MAEAILALLAKEQTTNSSDVALVILPLLHNVYAAAWRTCMIRSFQKIYYFCTPSEGRVGGRVQVPSPRSASKMKNIVDQFTEAISNVYIGFMF